MSKKTGKSNKRKNKPEVSEVAEASEPTLWPLETLEDPIIDPPVIVKKPDDYDVTMRRKVVDMPKPSVPAEETRKNVLEMSQQEYGEMKARQMHETIPNEIG